MDDRPEQLTWTRRFHIYAKENWYRDVWMFALTIVVAITVSSSQNTSNEAKNAVKQVQQERLSSILRACENQNHRHDATIAALNTVYKRKAPQITLAHINPQIVFAINLLFQAQRVSQRAPTIFLINALAPRTANCQKYAEQSVGATTH